MGRFLRAAVIAAALVAITATPAEAGHQAGLLRGRATMDYAPAQTVKWTDGNHGTSYDLRVTSGSFVIATFDLQTTYRIDKVLVDFANISCWNTYYELNLLDSTKRNIRTIKLCDLLDNIVKSIAPVSGVRYVRFNLFGVYPGHYVTIAEVEVYGTSDDSTPPAAPANVTATAGDGYVDLTWSAVGDADLAGYRVYRSTDGGATWPVSVDVGLSTAYRFSGLTNGVSYTFAVVAYDIARNESPKSQSVSATPRDMTPPAPPTGLVLEGAHESIVATWAGNKEADLAGYRIRYRVAGEAPWTLAGSVGTDTTTFTIVGLTNGQQYEVAVSAFDTWGNESPATAASAAPRDMAPPPPPAGLAAAPGNGKVVLTWQPNTEPDLAGYRVFFREAGASAWELAAELPAGATTYTVTGLTNEQAYEFGVTAYDTARNESAPSVTTATPTVIPPNPPAGLTAEPGDGEARLAWQPSPPPPDVDGYRVRYRLRGTQQWTLAGEADVLTFTIRGLTNGQEYEVAVVGFTTEDGESKPATAVVRPRAPGDPPPAPDWLMAEPSVGAVTLRWPAVQHEGLAGYRIYYRRSGDQWRYIGASMVTSYQVIGLTPGDRYEFGVTAIDTEGRESPMAVTVATPKALSLVEALLTADWVSAMRDGLGRWWSSGGGWLAMILSLPMAIAIIKFFLASAGG